MIRSRAYTASNTQNLIAMRFLLPGGIIIDRDEPTAEMQNDPVYRMPTPVVKEPSSPAPKKRGRPKKVSAE